MAFPERFSNLPEYAFPRLRALLDSHPPGDEPVAMSIGEPTHPMPDFVGTILAANVADFGRYPPNEGAPELLEAIAGWIDRRFGAALDPVRQIMVLNGSREGIFNATLALCPEEKRGRRPLILMPNPFYQAYAVGAVAAGAEPVYMPALPENGFLPDYAGLDAELLDRTTIAWICSPANPQGAVASSEYLRRLLALAERHDFRVFSDECYSEIWRDSPPPGALQVAAGMGLDPERVLVVNSLSKRSNMPGLRSGFVAGGPQSLTRIKRLRAYAGSPVPLALQRVSAAAWRDEGHVAASRALYAEKYALADEMLRGAPGFVPPQAGFYLWLDVGDGEAVALRLWREVGLRVLPGAYLGREIAGANPGRNYIRVALVAPEAQLRVGLDRLRRCLFE